MRLLDTQSLRVVEFNADSIPAYAILSHTWGPEEITYQDVQHLESRGISHRFTTNSSVKDKKGFPKVKSAVALAAREGYSYIWIDTCCIDKSSSAELSEAINSMYKWYEESETCYAFMSDVPPASEELPSGRDSKFRASRWFSRGWTLQELIAPQQVHFYAQDWTYLGSKREMNPGPHIVGANLLSVITGVDRRVLNNTLSPQDISVAARMSWASLRNTTREEDIAYCLLGIFAVNIPLLYGEGRRAFLRLQDAILGETDDQSIFAWRYESPSEPEDLFGLLAPSPRLFKDASGIRPLPPLMTGDTLPPSMSSQGLHVRLYLKPIQRPSADANSLEDYHAILDCSIRDKAGEKYFAIALRRLRGNHFARIRPQEIEMVKPPGLEVGLAQEGYKSIYVRQKPVWVLPDFIIEEDFETWDQTRQFYNLKAAFPPDRWDPQAMSLKSRHTRINGVMGLFRFGDPTGEHGDVGVCVGLRRDVHGQLRCWAFQRPLVEPVDLADIYAFTESHIRSFGSVQQLNPTMMGQDDVLPCQTEVREITRHGRSYISLQVMKRQEIYSKELPRQEVLLQNSESALSSIGIDQSTLQSLLQPCVVEDDMTSSIFDTAALSRKIRVRPIGQPYRHTLLQELAPADPSFKAGHGRHRTVPYSVEMDLFWACRNDDSFKVSKILSQGISPELETENFHSFRLLHWAALDGHVHVARCLLEAGADLYSTASGRVTPLHLAALMGHNDVISLFLVGSYNKFSRRKLLQAQTYSSLETPLHLAAVSSRCTEDTLRALSRLGPDDSADNSFIHSKNLLGEYPIHRAAAWGNTVAVKFLLEQTQRAEKINHIDNLGRSAQWHAAAGGSAECVRILASNRVNSVDPHGRTALHAACFEGHTEAVAALLQLGAEPDRPMQGQSPCLTPCHISALFGHLGCLRLLTEHGADINRSIAKGPLLQPIHLAAAQGHLQCVEHHIRLGADIGSVGFCSFKLLTTTDIIKGSREKKVELSDWWSWSPPVTAASMALAQGHNAVAAWLSSEVDRGENDEEMAAKS